MNPSERMLQSRVAWNNESDQLHDLLTDARYLYHGTRIYVEFNPQSVPAHIFRLRGHVKRKHDFDYPM